MRIVRVFVALLLSALLCAEAAPADAVPTAQNLVDYLNAAGLTYDKGWNVFDLPNGGPTAAGDVQMINRTTGEIYTIASDGVGRYVPKGVTQTVSPRVYAPSSVLTETIGATATDAQAAAGALGESGTVAKGGALRIIGGKLLGGAGVVGTALTGFELGYGVGRQLDDQACSLGVSALCWPTKGRVQAYSPNGDVGGDPAGWVPGGVDSFICPGSSSFMCGAGITGSISNWAWAPNTTTFAFHNRPAVGSAWGPVSWSQSAISGSSYAWAQGITDMYCLNTSGVAVRDSSGSGSAGNKTSFPFTAAGGYTISALTTGNVIATSGVCSGTGSGGFDHIEQHTFSSGSDGYGTLRKWYPPGHSLRPVYNADPDRAFVTTATCSGGGTTTATSATFKESATSWPQFPTPAACPAGQTITQWNVTETGNNPRTVGSYIVPPAIQTWQGGTGSAPGATCTAGGCYLGLWQIQPDATRLDCYGQEGRCAGWFADPNKTTKYECTYGIPGTRNVVALSECNVLSPTFDPDKLAKGVVVGNPVNGNIPDVPSKPTPLPVPVPLPGDQSCWPSGFAATMNPVSWVLQPVKCALSWAFVPDEATLAALQTQVRTALDSSGIADWYTAITANLALLGGSGSGCTGPTINFDLRSVHKTMQPFNACSDPMATVATISNAVSTVFIVVLGGLGALRGLSAGFGFDFGFGSRVKAQT